MEVKTPAVLRLVAFGPGVDETGFFDLRGHSFLIGKRGCHLDLPEAEIPDRAIRIRADESVLSFEGVGGYRIPLGSISVSEGRIELGKCLLLRLDPYEILIEPSGEPGEPIEPREPPREPDRDLPDPAVPAAAEAPDLDATMFSLPPAAPQRAPLSRGLDLTFQALDIHWQGLDGGPNVPVTTSPFLIGRNAGDMVLGDRRVSSKHAQLDVLGPAHFLLMDLASTNGTTVNGRPISASSVKNGDVVAFGGLAFRFVARAKGSRP